MRSLLHLAYLSLVLISPAFAQAPVPTLSQGQEGALTLRDALEEAVARNPELIALRRDYDAAAAVAAESRHLDAPSFETQIWAWPVTTLNPARTDMYMFMGEQALPGRGKRASRALVGERDAALTRSQVGVRTNESLDEVRRTYAELSLARETLVLYERQAPVLRDIAEAATLRYASGQAGQHHSVATLVELARLQADTATWRERARLAEIQLNTLLARPIDATVQPLMPQTLTVIPFEPTRVALERHPEMTMANAAIAREEAELARLRGERRPDYVVGGGYMLMPGEAGAWTARAGLTWPNAPWSRGRLDAEIAVQQRRVEAATARREVVASAIRRGVREAELRLEAARERVGLLATALIPHAEHAFDAARVAYSSNRGEFTEVIDSERTLLSARVEYAATRAEFELALSQLERAMGDARDDRWPVTASTPQEQP
jgi:cobalt-zinc-cadmium efflux system outer membrane protein